MKHSFSPTPPLLICFCFSYTRNHVCASLMWDVLLIPLRWIGERFIYVAETTNFFFFCMLLSSDETHIHILWHKFRPNKIFCTLIKHIFMLYKYFCLNFESNEKNLCQTMINFYNISCWEARIFEGSFEEANKWIIKVSLV